MVFQWVLNGEGFAMLLLVDNVTESGMGSLFNGIRLKRRWWKCQ